MLFNKKSITVFLTFLIVAAGVCHPCFAGKKTGKNPKVSSVVIKSNTASFGGSISHGVVLVDFYADWCVPCRRFAPVFEQVAGEMIGSVRSVKLNVDEGKPIAKEYNVTSFPTLVLFKDGKEVSRRDGGCDEKTLKAFIQQAL